MLTESGDTTIVIPKEMGVHYRNLFFEYIPLLQQRSIAQDSVITAQGAQLITLQSAINLLEEANNASIRRIEILKDAEQIAFDKYEDNRRVFIRERNIKERWRKIAIVSVVVSTTALPALLLK